MLARYMQRPCVCLSVCFIKTDERIELVFGVDSSYHMFQSNLGIVKIRALPPGTCPKLWT